MVKQLHLRNNIFYGSLLEKGLFKNIKINIKEKNNEKERN